MILLVPQGFQGVSLCDVLGRFATEISYPNKSYVKNALCKLGLVVHLCDPSTWKMMAGRKFKDIPYYIMSSRPTQAA